MAYGFSCGVRNTNSRESLAGERLHTCLHGVSLAYMLRGGERELDVRMYGAYMGA